MCRYLRLWSVFSVMWLTTLALAATIPPPTPPTAPPTAPPVQPIVVPARFGLIGCSVEAAQVCCHGTLTGVATGDVVLTLTAEVLCRTDADPGPLLITGTATVKVSTTPTPTPTPTPTATQNSPTTPTPTPTPTPSVNAVTFTDAELCTMVDPQWVCSAPWNEPPTAVPAVEINPVVQVTAEQPSGTEIARGYGGLLR